MTVNEIIMQGVTVTVQGILVVFLILVLIMLIIKAMSLFMSKDEKKTPQMSVEEPAAQVQAPEEANEEELIAVITAAVAACMGQSAASVNIRSYKKVSSAWGNAAKREILDNRF